MPAMELKYGDKSFSIDLPEGGEAVNSPFDPFNP